MREDEVTCPYCDKDFEINHDDGAHYQDGGEEEEQCPHCDKMVIIYTSISFYHEAQKADCLNGEPHPWSEWFKLWESDKRPGQVYMRRHCPTCNEEEKEWR